MIGAMACSTILISLWPSRFAFFCLWFLPLSASNANTKLQDDLTDEQRLLRMLRKNYDSSVRPVYDAKTAVIIRLGITLTQIIDVDEKNQVLTTNVWLDQEWVDEKLHWNATDYSNIHILRIPCDLIWLPDIVLYNSVENHNKGYMKSLAMVQHTGNVFWPPIVRMRSSCKMDITYFPFDDQICHLKLGSWAYDGNQVDVTNRTVDIDLSNYVDNGEWELIDTKIIRNVKFYPCCPEPFPDVMFYLHIRRRVLYYLLNVIIPCMLLSTLSLTGFLLPPDSGEKVTLGLTVLLAFSVFMLLVAENMPPTSEYIPLVGIYLTVIMAMSALSVALSVFVLNCHHRGAMLQRPPRLVRGLALAASRLLCMSLKHLNAGGSHTCGGPSFASSCGGHPPTPSMDNASHELHSGSPIQDNGVSSQHQRVIDIGMNGLFGESMAWSRTTDNPNIANGVGHFCSAAGLGNTAGGSGSQSTTARIEREILHYLRAVLEAHERNKVERLAVNEWQEVARVLDKIFFWVFVLVTSIATLVLLVFSPMTKDVNVPACAQDHKVIQVVDIVQVVGTSEGSASSPPSSHYQPLPSSQQVHQKPLRPSDRLAHLPDEQRLLNYIMRGYEKSVRPVRNASTAVVIRMGLTLTQIFDMDEKDQVLVTNVWLDQEWVDEFLVWDPADFNNITTFRIPCHKIWLPDIVLYNNAAEYTDGVMPANAMVDFTGNVFWPVPTKLQSSCKVDVTYFPFDYQICKLKFGSWTYDGYQVDITNRTQEVDLSNYVVNGEWELLYIRIVRNVVRYACCDEPFPDVTFYIRIRRRTLYYMYNVVFPCVMMSALTLLVFCLPPDSGEKIALGITVLLAFSVFMLAVAENLPETSEFVPLISIYLTIVMSLTSISVIMTVFVLNLHHRGPDKRVIPPWLRRLFLGSMRARGSVLNFWDRTNYKCSSGTQGADTGTHFMRNMSLKVTLENLAHELREELYQENGNVPDGVTVDTTPPFQSPPCSPIPPPTSFLVVNQQQFSSLQSNNNRRNVDFSSQHSPAQYQQQYLPPPTAQQHSTAEGVHAHMCQQGHKAQQSSARRKTAFHYEDVLMSLKRILERHEREEREFESVQDWRRLAQTVDRILFFFFLFLTVGSTLAILVITPAMQD